MNSSPVSPEGAFPGASAIEEAAAHCSFQKERGRRNIPSDGWCGVGGCMMPIVERHINLPTYKGYIAHTMPLLSCSVLGSYASSMVIRLRSRFATIMMMTN